MNKYLFSQKLNIGLSIIGSFFASIAGLVVVHYMQLIIDTLNTGSKNLLGNLFISLAVALIVSFLTGCVQVYLNSTITKKFHISAKNDIFRSLIKLEPGDKSSVGEKMSIFENDLQYIEDYYLENVIGLVKNSILLFLAIAYLLTISLKWGIALLIIMAILFVLPPLLGKKIDEVGEECLKQKGKYLQKLQEFFEGQSLINAFSIEGRVCGVFAGAVNKLEKQIFKLNINLGAFNQIFIVGNYCVIAVSLIVGGIMVDSAEISIGELIAATQLLNIITQPLGEIGEAVTEIRGSKTIRIKVEKIISKQYDPELDHQEDEKFEEIRFNNINYAIEDKKIVNHINLNIKNGKYVIIGPSGSGKTTLLKLMANIIKPEGDERYINGYRYDEYARYINHNIVYVSQDTFLFNDSIENNIKLYSDFDEALYKRAVQISCIEDKVSEDTQIICDDSNISGGEKQRISIARTVLLDPPIMLFDEITSALDNKTADRIIDNLLKLDNTMVFVTHKLHKDLLGSADSIICMDNGVIVEEGTLEQLKNRKGYFYNMYLGDRQNVIS